MQSAESPASSRSCCFQGLLWERTQTLPCATLGPSQRTLWTDPGALPAGSGDGSGVRREVCGTAERWEGFPISSCGAPALPVCRHPCPHPRLALLTLACVRLPRAPALCLEWTPTIPLVRQCPAPGDPLSLELAALGSLVGLLPPPGSETPGGCFL